MEDSAFWALKQPLKENYLLPNNINNNNNVCDK